jgi:hypothetical protein
VFLRISVGFHVTWLVNSATHLWGSRRFKTRDDSTNNWWVALLTGGEGWHNNHHAHPVSASHGMAWWEVDFNYWGIRLGAAPVGEEHQGNAPPCRLRMTGPTRSESARGINSRRTQRSTLYGGKQKVQQRSLRPIACVAGLERQKGAVAAVPGLDQHDAGVGAQFGAGVGSHADKGIIEGL